jgi:hypothetical protein
MEASAGKAAITLKDCLKDLTGRYIRALRFRRKPHKTFHTQEPAAYKCRRALRSPSFWLRCSRLSREARCHPSLAEAPPPRILVPEKCPAPQICTTSTAPPDRSTSGGSPPAHRQDISPDAPFRTTKVRVANALGSRRPRRCASHTKSLRRESA